MRGLECSRWSAEGAWGSSARIMLPTDPPVVQQAPARTEAPQSKQLHTTHRSPSRSGERPPDVVRIPDGCGPETGTSIMSTRTRWLMRRMACEYLCCFPQQLNYTTRIYLAPNETQGAHPRAAVGTGAQTHRRAPPARKLMSPQASPRAAGAGRAPESATARGWLQGTRMRWSGASLRAMPQASGLSAVCLARARPSPARPPPCSAALPARCVRTSWLPSRGMWR